MSNANWRHFDFWLLGVVAILTIFGVAMINSTIAGNIDVANNAQRQLTFAVIGFVFVFVMAAIDYHLWSSISTTLYGATFAVLVLLNVVAAAVFGSARWFKTALVNIQPSELAKIVLILTVSNYFAANLKNMGQFRVVFRSLLMALGLVIWVLIQPNMSTSILMMVIWFALWWASGMHFKHLLAFSGMGIALILVAIPLFPVLQEAKIINDYQIKRLQTFLAPEEEGGTYGDSYNIQQALISIGSGGLFGQGYGQGPQVQLRFLKVRWSDFIFSAMAHEFGFVGCATVMALELLVVYRCLRAARKAADTYGGLICYGVAILLAFQAMVNIGVNLKMLPATGLPLPFISYGGSSLFSLLLGIGLVESVMLRHKSLEF